MWDYHRNRLWEYEMTNQQLINVFVRACAESCALNSGLCISTAGPTAAEYVNYLKGVLLARLEGKTPLHKPGDRVCTRSPLQDSDWRGPTLEPGKQFIVDKVYYGGNGKWLLSLEGVFPSEGSPRPKYDASELTSV